MHLRWSLQHRSCLEETGYYFCEIHIGMILQLDVPDTRVQ